MKEHQFLPGEVLITVPNDMNITLTSLRIRQSFSHDSGNLDLTSIMLEKISSIEVKYVSKPYLLIIGGISIVAGFVIGLELRELLILAGAVMIGSYFTTRRYEFRISSDGGTALIFQAKGMKKERLLNFIDQIEEAKDKRMGQLARI